MLDSLGKELSKEDFLVSALGNQHVFVIIQASNTKKPLVVKWPDLLKAILASVPSNPGGQGGVEVRDEGSIIAALAQFLNFVGPGVVVTPNGLGVDVNIAGAPAETADNGLSKNTATNTRLGGTLIQDTTITAAGFWTLFTGSLNAGSLIGLLRSINNGNSAAIFGNNTGSGVGVRGVANTNIGVYGSSASGTAGYFLSSTGSGVIGDTNSAVYGGRFNTRDANPNTVISALQIFRGVVGGAGAIGIGVGLDFAIAADNGGAITNIASRLISRFTDVGATGGTESSEFSIRNKNAGIDEEQFVLNSNGSAKLNKYGSNTFANPPKTAAGFDANGNVVEFAPSIRYKSTIDGTVSSGVSLTISASHLIPANTGAAGTIFRIYQFCRMTGTGGAKTARIYINTVNSLAGSPVLIATYASLASALSLALERHLRMKTATSAEVFPAVSNGNTDIIQAGLMSTLTIDTTVDLYVIYTGQCASGVDTIITSTYLTEVL
jgi:hypothetical protein